jgi:tetratricopeptide (TPR) repeat protein
MSYINDALQKAQKEKESRYVAYGNIISGSREKLSRSWKWLSIIGISIVFFSAVGIIVLLYGSEDLLYRSKKRTMPVASTPLVSIVPAVVQAEPPIVKKTAADNNKEYGSATETVSAKLKPKQEIADSRIIYEQAIKKQRKGRLDEAKSLYKKVIKIDPRNIQALNNLGVIYMNKKVYKWAIIRLNDALKIKYNYSDAHYNLACLYAQKNEETRSLFHLKKAIGFNPQVREWAANDGDLKVMADLPEFKKLLEKK